MLLTDEIQRSGGGDAGLVDAIYRHLLGPDRGDAPFIDRLRDAGLPEPLAARASAMIQAVYSQSGVNIKQVWLAPKGVDPPLQSGAAGVGASIAEVAANVRHLATLARAGALLAPVVDLSDPSALERVGSVLDHKGVLLNAVHLSNALEYVLDPSSIVDQIATLPRVEGAIVLSSTGSGFPDPRMGNWYTPGVNPIETWLAPDGIRSQLKSGGRVSNLLTTAFLPFEAGKEISSGGNASTEELRLQLQQVIDAYYAQPSWALETLAHQLSRGGAVGTIADLLRSLEALGIDPPGGPDEVRGLTRALLPLLSTATSP